MPQFDISSFFNQIIWLSFFFSGFYFILLGFFLPGLVASLKGRYKKEKNELSLPAKIPISANKTYLLISVGKKPLSIKSTHTFCSAL